MVSGPGMVEWGQFVIPSGVAALKLSLFIDLRVRSWTRICAGLIFQFRARLIVINDSSRSPNHPSYGGGCGAGGPSKCVDCEGQEGLRGKRGTAHDYDFAIE